MKKSFAAFIAMVAMVLGGAQQASAGSIYVLSNNSTSSAYGAPTSFGKVDTSTGVYTDIASLPTNTWGLALSPTDGTFFTTVRDNGDMYLRTLTSTGSLSGNVGGSTGGGRSTQGLAWRSANSTLYAFMTSSDSIGTINTSTGAYSVLNPSGPWSYGAYGGSMTSMNDTLYVNWDGDSLSTVNPTTGAFTNITTSSDYSSMSMASDGTVLYGLANKSLYSINTTTGATTKLLDITGASYDSGAGTGVGNYFHGAVWYASTPVPEIDPAGLGSVAALVTGTLGLLERRRR